MELNKARFTQQQKESFYINVAKLFNEQYPKYKVFDSNGRLDYDSFFKNYHLTFSTKKGVLTDRGDIKRIQDAIQSYFVKKFQKEIEQRINNGEKFKEIYAEVTEQAKDFLLPYVLDNQRQVWKNKYQRILQKQQNILLKNNSNDSMSFGKFSGELNKQNKTTQKQIQSQQQSLSINTQNDNHDNQFGILIQQLSQMIGI